MLNLAGNPYSEVTIGDEGAKALAKMLEVCLLVSCSLLGGLPPGASRGSPPTVAHIQIFDTQANSSLQTLYINGEIPVSKLRGDDEKCTELLLSGKGYEDADAIIIASLLKVLFCFLFFLEWATPIPSPVAHPYFCLFLCR